MTPPFLSVRDRALKGLGSLSARVFQWGPARRYARRFIVPRVLPQMMTGDLPTQEMAAVRRSLQQMANGTRPILVGPWVSEVGFELLYWIPFLNWVTSYRPFDPARLVVISRGGVESWYRHLTGRYLDVFDVCTPQEFGVRNRARLRDLTQKQLEPTDLDREIVERATRQLGTTDVDLLHPMFMYTLFLPFWKSRMSMHLVDEFTSFQPLAPPDASGLDRELPGDFVAVRFYFNESLPDTGQNRAFIARVIRTLTESVDVVLLDPELRVDDHQDARIGPNRRVHSIAHLITARNNLDVQTKVISRARAFVGTYGGLSYLAPLCGVPAVTFYSDRTRFSAQHLDLARRTIGTFGGGTYIALDTKDLDVLALTIDASLDLERTRG